MADKKNPSGQGKTGRSAYEIIKGWIFDKRIAPGEKLSERSTAEELGLSRVPVREAFQRLTLEGILVNVAGKGLCLRVYNEQDIADLYMYREALDGMAARIFTIRADRVEIEYLRMIYQEMEGMIGDYHSRYWEEKDIEFHTIIARGSRNLRILGALSNVLLECLYLSKIYGSVKRSPDDDSPPAHLPEVLAEHGRILEAISAGDPDHSEAVARQSVRAGLERIMKSFVRFNRNLITNGSEESSG